MSIRLVPCFLTLTFDPYEGGRFAIIFLSPIDCHRVFSPQDGCLEEVVHVPGARLLVHPPFQRAEYPVYTLNERVILRLSAESGSCVVVMVAGWGVGNITLPFAPSFRPGSKTSGVLSLGVASHRQTRRLDCDVRARFIGRADHVVIARTRRLWFPLTRRSTMDSPSSDSPLPTVLSHREREAGDGSQAVQYGTGDRRRHRPLIAGFGNRRRGRLRCLCESRRFQGNPVVVADEKIRRLVEPPVRSLSMDEFRRSNLRHAERARPRGRA